MIEEAGVVIDHSQQLERMSSRPRRGRGCLVWLGGIVAVLLGLLLLGALYEAGAEAAAVRAHPPPGQLVDVGGHRLHIYCVGTGSPTVVIDAGLGDWSATWSSWVQPEVARTTRVCTYDRAGMGWSEAGPRPRTAATFARELHTLLHQGGVPGPYVLVGHSLGGLPVRVFAHAYAAEVAGVVLIESMHPRQAKPPPVARPPLPAAPASELSIATLPARLGLLRLSAGPLSLSAGLSPAVADAYAAFSVTPRYVQTTLDESEGMLESLAQAGTVDSFGAVPLIVLSRGVPEGQEQEWQRLQTDLLHLSSNSQQQVAEKSGHNVQLEQPEAATGAIVQMVDQLRR
ncbi:MAG: alpha/beta hydrolase [Chloroflexi bacterium]|nr:alpha/beta hydrolase [Chloroflexota bacterium]